MHKTPPTAGTPLRRLASEDGIALPVAIMVLFIILTLTTAAVSVSVHTNSSTQRDNNVKAALAAAEAGLQAATYRLNMLHPSESGKYCIGEYSAEVANVTGGYCKKVEGSLGNKGSYAYWTSEALKLSGSCIGQTVTTTGENQSLMQRCLVAEGVVNGIRRRVSERVAAFVAKPLFPVEGVTGLKKLTIENNDLVKASAGTNGKLTLKNGAEITGAAVLGPSGELAAGTKATTGAVLQHSTSEGPITLGSKDPGDSATKNVNYYIAKYLENPSKPTKPYDTASKVVYSESTRKLSMENGALLVLEEGIYNFCSFEAKNNATIELAANAKVTVYIDSAKDPNSECPATGSGVFKVWNNAEIINPTHDPTALQIYVYDGSGGEVFIKNNSELYATIYAPFSKVKIENNGTVHGAIAGDEVELGNNFAFEWYEGDGHIQKGTVGNYYRSSWAECQPETTSANPQSGC